MKIYFESDMGCGIRTYPNLKAAEVGIKREVGTANNPHKIRPATDYDLEWVKGMGGYIP